jgi:hypothetical protein
MFELHLESEMYMMLKSQTRKKRKMMSLLQKVEALFTVARRNEQL